MKLNKDTGKGIVFMAIGFELIAMAFAGYYGGIAIDQFMGWKNVASTYLVLALLISWFIHLVYLLQRFEKENVDSDPKP